MHNRLSLFFFFFATIAAKKCLLKCMIPTLDGVVRPDVKEFDRFFPIFLGNRPDLQCPKGYVLLFAHSHHTQR